jgi:hypothetical protein
MAALLVPAASLAQDSGPPRDWNARISGRVVSAETGLPMAGVRVSLNSTFLFTKEVPSVFETVTSDANGAFELPLVPRGDYTLNATAVGYYLKGRRFGAASQRMSVGDRQTIALTLAMERGGAIVGRVVDELGEPVAAVQVRAMRYEYVADGRRVISSNPGDVTDDLGRFRVYGLPHGDFVLVASVRNAEPASVGNSSPVAQADVPPTYFPGTLNAAEAQTLFVGPGQEVSAQFVLLRGRGARVSGRVITSTGAPAAGVRASLVGLGHVSSRPIDAIAPDGTFELAGVAPGNYWIAVLGMTGTFERGSIPVTVGTDDISGLSIVTTRGTTLRGLVVFEGQRPPDFHLTAPFVGGMRGSFGMFGSGGFITAEPDGRFESPSVIGHVTFSPTSADWMLKAVTVGGVDVLETGIDLAGKAVVSGIRITVTDRLTSVSGRVTGDKGQARAGHLVILFRLDGRPPGDLGIRAVRTDAAGRFDARKLRPGSWVAGVVEDLEPGYHFSPDFQDRLRQHGQRFSLADGEAVVLNLAPTTGL